MEINGTLFECSFRREPDIGIGRLSVFVYQSNSLKRALMPKPAPVKPSFTKPNKVGHRRSSGLGVGADTLMPKRLYPVVNGVPFFSGKRRKGMTKIAGSKRHVASFVAGDSGVDLPEQGHGRTSAKDR